MLYLPSKDPFVHMVVLSSKTDLNVKFCYYGNYENITEVILV
jgi:hypothetical protein